MERSRVDTPSASWVGERRLGLTTGWWRTPGTQTGETRGPSGYCGAPTTAALRVGLWQEYPGLANSNGQGGDEDNDNT